jgi:CRP-like cAMP-binding protein
MHETNILEEIPESIKSLLPKASPMPPLRGSLRVKTRAKLRNLLKSKTENAMINLLHELPFVKYLPSYTLQDICHIIKEQTFKKHEIILKQGDTINNIYIVKSGSFIFTINHESISHVSQDINSFIRYQSITEEPFLEKRKYELTGKIKNNEEIPIFIYQSKKLFGDIEIISGRNTSIFNIYANEDNSSLYIIDRMKWVKLTKKIRVIFTRLTLKKIEIIYDRILEVLKGKDNLNINKMKLYKQKILEQIEISNNYDIYFNQI